MGQTSVATAAAAALLVLAACAALPARTAANKISINWKPNVNYTDWLKQHSPFYKDDWLVFYYTAGQADVVQVDEVGYNKCDATNAVYNYSKGRTFAFQLNETKTYYFICSYGYCFGGMRLAIKAEKLPPPSPPPSASDRSAAIARSHAVVIYAAVAVLAALLRMV
ncbi:early nodulin-like protein 16 [Miscanthus floridulus]|uniref:early nodulin-like protein 16 n=1 Tax=Miscanthus floridulus TaxID=154761 RepID=UPI0034599827